MVKQVWQRIRSGKRKHKERSEDVANLCENDGLVEEVDSNGNKAGPSKENWDEIKVVSTTETDEKNTPPKKKKFRKRAKKASWRLMKGTWKCLKTGLVSMAYSMNSFSMTGAMETAVKEYSSHKMSKYHNKER